MTEFLVLVLLILAPLAWELLDVPQFLFNLLRRHLESIRPSFGCVMVAAWLVLAAGIALVLYALAIEP